MASTVESREALVNERLAKVWGAGVFTGGGGVGPYKEGYGLPLEGSFTADTLRAIANAIDCAEDATRAMITDLQEESAAYQRGLTKGPEVWLEAIMDAARQSQAEDRQRERMLVESQ